ncbi:Fibronectin type III domain-containing protein, partial [Paenibacillus sp. 1_12]
MSAGVSYSPNGESVGKQSMSTKVSVAIPDSIPSAHTYYQWSSTETVPEGPNAGWVTFTSEDSITTPPAAGTWYLYVRVDDQNENHTVGYSHSKAFKVTMLSAPTNVIATAGNGTATISFNAPVSDGGSAITGYTVTSNPGGFTGTSATASPITVTGLTNGTAYTFTVVAKNGAGDSAASAASASVTPNTKVVPGAPTNVKAIAGNEAATVSFNAPVSDGGSAITGYTVTSKPGGFTGTSTTASPIIVRGLEYGTAYTFTVVATNAVGDSAASVASASVTPNSKTWPGAPWDVRATAGNGTATVSFDAPASDGGNAITLYTVTSNPGGFTGTSATASPITVRGLANGTAYTFTVVAKNGIGDSAASVPSERVIPSANEDYTYELNAMLMATITGYRGVDKVVNIPAELDGHAVVALGRQVFMGKDVSKVTIPVGITSIGEFAFYNSKLTSVTIPVGVTSIEQFSFYGTQLTNVTIPGSVTSIGKLAFANSQLTSVTLSEGVTSIGESAFSNNQLTRVTIPNSVTSIGEGVFYSNQLTSVTIPSSVTSIGQSAFKYNRLTSVTLSEGVTSIGKEAFSNNQLTSVTFPSSLKSIGLSAFEYNRFTSVRIPKSVESVGIYAFENNSLLTSVIVEGDLTAIGVLAFGMNSDRKGTIIGFNPSTAKDYANNTWYPFLNILSAGVSFSPNGESVGKQSVSTKVTVDIPDSAQSAKTYYQWSPTETVLVWPNAEWVAFTSEDSIPTPSTVGTWYLHVRVDDQNASHATGYSYSKAFKVIAVPSAPTNVTANAGNGVATVSFAAPASNGGNAITGYTVTSSPGGFTGTSASVSPITVTGLTNGTAYTFTVVAKNGAGDSASSEASSSVTPTAPIVVVPDAPTNVTAISGDGEATVSFDAPASDGGSAITQYTVTSSPGGFTGTSETAGSITITGLTNGTAYTFTVVARNIIGDSAASASETPVVPSGAPSAPRNVRVSAGNGAATVSFDAPVSDGGSEIFYYKVASDPGRFIGTSMTASPITVTGLTNGTSYTFVVYVENYAGYSAISEASASVTPTAPIVVPSAPGTPMNVTATAGNGTATVSFDAPANDGGSAITLYTVTSSPGGFTKTSVIASPVTFTGLTNGTAYAFKVVAKNGAGDSAASEASASVTPTAPIVVPIAPGTPTNVTATAGNGTATVSFNAPANDGGSAITLYTVTSSPGGFTKTSVTASPVTFTGLTNGTAYTFKVVAKNGAGDSAASEASASVTPTAPIVVPSAPGMPTNVTATAGNGTATVSFDAPASDGGNAITLYTVTSNPGGFTGTSATASPITVRGLTNGTAYTFKVVAKNGIGDSAASEASASVTPTAAIVVPSAPGTPTNVTATAGNGTATVSFDAPASDGGSAITGYTVTSSPGGFTGTSATASPITVRGLTNGTAYTFTVVATNGVGDSAASLASVSVTPISVPGVPGAPTNVTATAGNGAATVSFDAPVSDGGSAIMLYTAKSSPGGFTGTSATASPITVTGLTYGTAYTFTVIATNVVGDSAASVASASVTP